MRGGTHADNMAYTQRQFNADPRPTQQRERKARRWQLLAPALGFAGGNGLLKTPAALCYEDTHARRFTNAAHAMPKATHAGEPPARGRVVVYVIDLGQRLGKVVMRVSYNAQSRFEGTRALRVELCVCGRGGRAV